MGDLAKNIRIHGFWGKQKIVARGLEVILYWGSQSPSIPFCAVLPEVLEALDTMRPHGTSPFQTGTLHFPESLMSLNDFSFLFIIFKLSSMRAIAYDWV